MQLIVTDAWLAKSRAIHLTGSHLLAALLASALALMLLSLGLYHWVFLKGAREGWPIIAPMVKLVAQDDVAQRDRFLRENLNLMARRLGELQAKLTQLESLGERVSGLAGVQVPAKPVAPGLGGALVAAHELSLQEIQQAMAGLDQLTRWQTDHLTELESRLFDLKMKRLMTPTQVPVPEAAIGSPFGWRIDPISGRAALHTGLDFAATTGTPILAAAGGMVVAQEVHPEYGNLVEIDHGNQLITRYAHCSRVLVKKGDVIRPGQKIAEVGNSGRSTGAHLHFEVWVSGVVQDPQKFLAANQPPVGQRVTGLAPPRFRPQ